MRNLILLLLLVLPAHEIAAQPLAPGSIVRIWSADSTLRRTRAELLQPIGDTLVVRVSNGPRLTYRVPMASVTRLEHLEPRTIDEGKTHGFRVGVAVGAILGGAIVFPESIAPCEYVCTGGPLLAAGMLSGAVIGGIMGSRIGTISPGRKWRCIRGTRCRE